MLRAAVFPLHTEDGPVTDVIVGFVHGGTTGAQLMLSIPKFAISVAVITILSTSSKLAFELKTLLNPGFTANAWVPVGVPFLNP